jgi:undecaprenyl-diphosphatase
MDYFLFRLLNQLAGRWLWLDSLAIFLASYCEYILVSLFLIWLLWRFLFQKPERKKTIQWFFLAVISVTFSRLIITELIRFFYYRPRPFVAEQVYQLLEHSATGSFPSGHAAFFFALSTIIYLVNKKVGLLFFVASFLICLARIFVGLHYPLDIAAGLLIGIFSGWIVKKIIDSRTCSRGPKAHRQNFF